MTVKFAALVPVPALFVTEIGPVVAAPERTFARRRSSTEKFDAGLRRARVPLNVTAVTPLKFVPVILTHVPTLPLVGEKLVIVGALRRWWWRRWWRWWRWRWRAPAPV